jgi:hypothetical protein
MPTNTTTTSTLIHELTLGPLNAQQRHEIMIQARVLTAEARRLFRRLLILAQARGLDGALIARAAAQARAHVAGVSQI